MPNYLEQKSLQVSELLSRYRSVFLGSLFVLCLLVWFFLAFGLETKTFEKLVSMLPTALNTIVGIGVSVLITTFSFVFVALSLVSVQFSPRVVRHFWNGDFFRRIFLWSFIVVFGLCFVVQFIDSTKLQLFALTLGFYLIFVLFPNFLSYLANNLNAASIIENVAAITVWEIKEAYESLPKIENESDVSQIKSKHTGFLEAIDSENLVKIFSRLRQQNENLTMKISNYIGSFVENSSALVEISPNFAVDEQTANEIAKCFRLNKFRSINQDVEYGIRQLVDIAIKAISPSVNDPTTCVNCLNYLGVIIKTLANRNDKSLKAKYLEQHNIILREPSFEKYVDDAFNQIYQWGKSDYIIVKNMIYILTDIISIIPNEKKFDAILYEIEEMELTYLFDESQTSPIQLAEHRKYLRKALRQFYLTASTQAQKINLSDKSVKLNLIAQEIQSKLQTK